MLKRRSKKEHGVSFYGILLSFVIIPAIVISFVLGTVMYTITSKESEAQLSAAMISLVTETGIAFDATGKDTAHIEDVIDKLDNSKMLGFPSAYLYFVDNTGIVLYHPDTSKKGAMIQNDAVRGLAASLEKGEKIDKNSAISYVYN